MVRKIEDITYIEFQYLKKRQNKRPIDFDDVKDTVHSVSKFLERENPSDKQIEKSLDKFHFLGESQKKQQKNENEEEIELDYQVFRDLLFDLFDLENDSSKLIEHNFQHLQRQAQKQDEFIKQMDSFITNEKKFENESMVSSKKSSNTQNTQRKDPKSLSQIERQGTLNSVKSMESYLQDREVTYDDCGIRTVVTTIEPKPHKEKSRETFNSIGGKQEDDQLHFQEKKKSAYITQSGHDEKSKENALDSLKVKQKALYGLGDSAKKHGNYGQISSARNYMKFSNQNTISTDSYDNFRPLYSRNMRKNNTLNVQKSYQEFRDKDLTERKRRDSHNLRRYDDPYLQKTLNNQLGNQNIRAYKNKPRQQQQGPDNASLNRFEDSYHQKTIEKLLNEKNKDSQQNEENLIKQTQL